MASLRKLLPIILLLLSGAAFAASPCGAPTPGNPHVCIAWTYTQGTTAASTFNVYRSTTSGGENYGTPLNTTAIPVTQLFFYDTTNTTGTTYFYTVVAVSSGGVMSAPSSEVSAQVPVPPNAVTTPTASID